MKLSNSLLFFTIVVCEISTSEVPRPRGVSLSRAPLYNPSVDFTCFDQSLTIPFSLVNDDYCDCPDASDEPGTSACPQGIFHCTNAGHKPLNIASSRVNDGVCDCCDASDEYVSGKCVNNCKELGRSAREEAQRRAELVKAGKELRAEMSLKGVALKQEHKEKLAQLQKQMGEAEKVLKEKEEIKKEIEERESVALEQYRKIEEENRRAKEEAEAAQTRSEATETFAKYDSNQDGLLDLHEIQSRATYDKDRNGEVSEEEAKYFLNEKDSVNLEEFIADSWSRVKPYLMMEEGLFKPPVGEGHVEEVDHKEDVEYDEGTTADDQEPTASDHEHEEEEEEEEEEDETTHEPETEDKQSTGVPYDDATQELVNQATQARSDFTESEQAVRNLQTDIKNIEEYLEKDFGPDEAFAPLVGQCFEYTDYEYIYKLCPFDRATQQSKSGSVDTRLGTWAKWNGPDGTGKYSSMLYDRGQSCWNGPQRTTVVKVMCSSENKLMSVSEPNRCEYMYEFSTPAACHEAHDDRTSAEDRHDEL